MANLNIIGTVGAGKTTLSRRLHHHTNWPVAYEAQSEILSDETRRILEKYYANVKAHALEKNLFFLHQRELTIQNNATIPAHISDRFLYDDYLMADLNYRNGDLTENEWLQYQAAFRKVERLQAETNDIHTDVLIFVQPPFEVTLEHIEERGRQEELVSTHPELRQYYASMYQLYDEFYHKWQGPKLKVLSSQDADIAELIANIKTLQPTLDIEDQL